MSARIVSARRAVLGRTTRSTLGRCALVAIGAVLGTAPVSTYAADLTSASSISITAGSQAMHRHRQPPTVQSGAAPDAKLDHAAAQGRIVDQLYEQLMHGVAGGCPSASTSASMARKC